ncbi:unnamed protein product [Musa hybrid cultivar]
MQNHRSDGREDRRWKPSHAVVLKPRRHLPQSKPDAETTVGVPLITSVSEWDDLGNRCGHRRISLPFRRKPQNPSGAEFARAGIEKLGFLIGPDVSSGIAVCCVVLEEWEVLDALLPRI